GNPTLIKVKGEDITVIVLLGHDILRFNRLFNIVDLITVLSSSFKLQVFRSSSHFPLQIIFNILRVTIEESANPCLLRLIFCNRHLMVARTNTLSEMVIETSPFLILTTLA